MCVQCRVWDGSLVLHMHLLLDCTTLLTPHSHPSLSYSSPTLITLPLLTHTPHSPTPHPHPSDTLTQLDAVTTQSVSVCTLRPVFKQSSSLTSVASTASLSSTTSAAATARPTSPPPPPPPPPCPVQGSKTKQIQLLSSECRKFCWGDKNMSSLVG